MKAHRIGVKQEIEIGELLAKSTLKYKKIYHDLIIAPGGRSTQIDLVLLCNKGLFVIESKNYRETLISGKEKAKVWQVWTSRGQKNFYNPLIQNKTHIELLTKAIGKKIPMQSIIVFPDSTDISSVNFEGVCKVSGLFDQINKSKTSLTEQQVAELVKLINEAKGDSSTRQEHLEKVTNIKKNLRKKSD